jgi:hypothetical protein
MKLTKIQIYLFLTCRSNNHRICFSDFPRKLVLAMQLIQFLQIGIGRNIKISLQVEVKEIVNFC